MFGNTVAVFASFFFVFWLVPFSAYWAIIDPFLALFSVCSALFLWLSLKNDKALNPFLFGLFLGLGIVFKQTMVVFAVGAGLTALFFWRSEKSLRPKALFPWHLGKALKGKALTAIAGFLVFPLLMLAYLLLFNSFEAFFLDLAFPLTQLSHFSVVTFDARILIALAAFAFVPIALLAFAKNFLEIKKMRTELMFLFLFLAFSFATTLPFRGCCIHFISVLPFASVLAGLVIALAIEKKSLLFSAVSIALLVGAIAAMAFFQGYYSSEIYSFQGLEGLAQTIEARTSPQEKILVLPATPELYLLSKRQPASRQFYFFDIYSEEFQQNVVKDLEQSRPGLVLYLVRGKAIETAGPVLVDEFVKENYSLVEELEVNPPVYKFFSRALIFEPRQN